MSHLVWFQLTAQFDKTLGRVAHATDKEVESVIADLQVGGAVKHMGVNVQAFTQQIYFAPLYLNVQ